MASATVGGGGGAISLANADAERTLLRIKQKLEGVEAGGRRQVAGDGGASVKSSELECVCVWGGGELPLPAIACLIGCRMACASFTPHTEV